MFADYNNFFYLIKILTQFLIYLMKNLKKIGFWFKANKLSRNSKKTKCILFHIKSSKDDQPLKLLALKRADNTVERKRAIKLLGVMSDENIS